jgi:hypothetical protein
VHSVLADPAYGAWTFGSSILSFAFPMLLFIAVATWLYVTYTKPELVPGHRNLSVERPIVHTAVPGPPPQPPAADDQNKAGTEGGE